MVERLFHGQATSNTITVRALEEARQTLLATVVLEAKEKGRRINT